MKKLYWRSNKVPLTGLVLLALLAMSGLILVETFRETTRRPHYTEKLAASRLAREAFDVIKDERLRRRIAIHSEMDPAQSGLIGLGMSPVTSNAGHLAAKQSSVNPNFAAVVVAMLKEAGVKEGDTVAVGVSGSFPALNVATYAALHTLKVNPVIIASASSSEWGANIPNYIWLDMESVLARRDLIPFRSIAASLGGINDRGYTMSAEGRNLLLKALERNKVPLIELPTLEESIEKRMQLYYEATEGGPIQAYINVGGGQASLGSMAGRRTFKAGLNRTARVAEEGVESVMARFVEEGVPVIHLGNVAELADRYGLPHQPEEIPNPGQGTVFVSEKYDEKMAIGVLAGLIIALILFLRSDMGARLFGSSPKTSSVSRPEQMV